MKNNNIWTALVKPLAHRPGDPTPENIERCHTQRGKHAGGRPPKMATTKSQVREATRRATVKNPWNLSPRRMQVLELIVRGFDRTQVANQLNITYTTAAQYFAEVMQAVGARNEQETILAWHRHFQRMPDPQAQDAGRAFAGRLAAATEQCRAQRKEAA